MKIAVYLDDVNNAIDNAMQWAIMNKISENLSHANLLIIDPLKIGKNESIKLLMKQDYDVLLTYNKTGTDLTLNQNGQTQALFSAINRKHIAWLVEHPLTFYDLYIKSQCDRHYIFPSQSHAFFSEMMGLKGSYSVQMFGSQPTSFTHSYDSREYDVCIAAQWRGPADINAFWSNSTGKTRQFFEDVLYLQDNLESRDTFMAFLAAAKHHGIPEEEIVKGSTAMRIMYWYARKKERISLVQDFAASGLKIALIGGDAWKAVLPNHNNVHFIEPMRHDELKTWYLKSKSVVTMNNFNGANERVFDCMAAGALPFSENAPALIETLGQSQAIFYEPNKASEKIEELRQALSSDRAQEMANLANLNFLANHTWHHRGKYLISLITDLLTRTEIDA